jgi:cytoskeleton protein RodZ
MKPSDGFFAKIGRIFKRESVKQTSESGDVTVRSSDPGTPVGQLLSETREGQNITLEQAESATRIRTKYLVALENGEYDKLPTPGHVYGFLRNYAIYLGLDWKEVESMYAKERPTQRYLDPGIFHPKDIALAPRRSWFKADLILGSIIALVIIVVGAWVFMQYGRPLLSPILTLTATATSTATPKPSATKPVATATVTPKRPTATPTEPVPTATPTATLDAPLPIATPTPLPTWTPTPAPEQADSVVLSIKVIERTWLQVTVDGEELPGQLLEADDEREWEGKYTIYFICGNAGGVQVTVNGEELGTLGERGEVVEKLWTPQGEATPTPEAEEPLTPSGTPTPSATPTVFAGGEETPTATPES